MKYRIHCAHRLSAAPAMSLRQTIIRPGLTPSVPLSATKPLPLACLRSFATTPQPNSWLIPKRGHSDKNRKGRPRVPTGGSTRGTTVVWGDYGIRVRDHDRRVTSSHLEIAMAAIKQRLRGQRYRIFTRVAANIGVYESGNQVRMGKGKGKFAYWCARMAASQVLFEISGTMHEEQARDAMRIAGNKLPGAWDFAKKGDPPIVGLTPMHPGVTMASLRKPLRNQSRETIPGINPLTTPAPPSKVPDSLYTRPRIQDSTTPSP